MVTLDRKKYEKNKNLFQLKSVIWDTSSNDFIQATEQNIVEINKIENLSKEQKTEFTNIINKWKEDIKNISIKTYNASEDQNKIYTDIANTIGLYINYLTTPILNDEDEYLEYKEKNDYFYCCIKNQELYLSFGIFGITKDDKNKAGEIMLSLSYPESQSIKEERNQGAFGACGHNTRVSMINHIFLNKSVKFVYSYPVNDLASKALKEIKFW